MIPFFVADYKYIPPPQFPHSNQIPHPFLWGHSPQNTPFPKGDTPRKMTQNTILRFQCGKFSQSENRIKS